MQIRDLVDTEDPSQLDIVNFQAAVETSIEAFRSEYTSAQSALRTAMIINAGAAIALLAFVGNLWPDVGLAPTLMGLVNSLSGYVLGVLFGAVGLAAHHAMHYFMYAENERWISISKWTYIGLLSFSFAAFALGSWFVYFTLVTKFGST